MPKIKNSNTRLNKPTKASRRIFASSPRKRIGLEFALVIVSVVLISSSLQAINNRNNSAHATTGVVMYPVSCSGIGHPNFQHCWYYGLGGTAANGFCGLDVGHVLHRNNYVSGRFTGSTVADVDVHTTAHSQCKNGYVYHQFNFLTFTTNGAYSQSWKHWQYANVYSGQTYSPADKVGNTGMDSLGRYWAIGFPSVELVSTFGGTKHVIAQVEFPGCLLPPGQTQCP